MNATFYAPDNPFTSQEEKLEIESWYQLPTEIPSYALLIASALRAYSYTSGWIAYGSAALAGVILAILPWALSSRSWVVPFFMALQFPFVRWILHPCLAAWLAMDGHWKPTILIAASRLLFGIPADLLASLTNQLLFKRYGMHPKYEFSKHVYGRSYSFEHAEHAIAGAQK